MKRSENPFISSINTSFPHPKRPLPGSSLPQLSMPQNYPTTWDQRLEMQNIAKTSETFNHLLYNSAALNLPYPNIPRQKKLTFRDDISSLDLFSSKFPASSESQLSLLAPARTPGFPSPFNYSINPEKQKNLGKTKEKNSSSLESKFLSKEDLQLLSQHVPKKLPKLVVFEE